MHKTLKTVFLFQFLITSAAYMRCALGGQWFGMEIVENICYAINPNPIEVRDETKPCESN